MYARPEHGRHYWVVRYIGPADDGQRLRTIYLGSAEHARRVKAVIARWREEALPEDERRKRDILELVKVKTTAMGCSGRASRRIRAATLAALDDPRNLIAFAFGWVPPDPAARSGRRVGRPARARLW